MFVCSMPVLDLGLRHQMAAEERHTVSERQGRPPDPQRTRQPLQNNPLLCSLRKAAGYRNAVSYMVKVLNHETRHDHTRTQ